MEDNLLTDEELAKAESKTYWGLRQESGQKVNELILLIVKELRLDKLVDWLEKKLG
ncbi:MAG: hypothetical protein M0021_09915 [Clostridia bacterium]|nr:hypothetical protein [Clostridia bacterium]